MPLYSNGSDPRAISQASTVRRIFGLPQMESGYVAKFRARLSIFGLLLPWVLIFFALFFFNPIVDACTGRRRAR